MAPASMLRHGAYVLFDPPVQPQVVLIASGSEVPLIVAAAELLAKDNVAARVVSMPSWDLFDAQPPEYRDSVLPPSLCARVAVEAGVGRGWERYVGSKGRIIAIDGFGASAPGPVIMREYGFTPERIRQQALAVLSSPAGGGK
jgi:transketolase